MGNVAARENRPNYIVCATAAVYISRWNLEHEPKIPDVFDASKLRKFRNMKDIDSIKEIKDILLATVSRAHELSVYFKVPNKQMLLSTVTRPPSTSPNQLLVTFINFLLLMIEAIVFRNSYRSIEETIPTENLRTELGFLITFLGDTTMHLQPIPTHNIMLEIEAVVNQVGTFIFSYLFTFSLHLTVFFMEEDDWLNNDANIEAMPHEVGIFLSSILNKSLEAIALRISMVEEINSTLTEIKDLVHKVQSFIDFFLVTENDQVQEAGTLDLALSNLLPKFELLNTKIKEHCITVSKLPTDHMAPNTALLSLFIVDSVLDDLMYRINNEWHETNGVDDQIVRLHKELMSLGSSINEIVKRQQAEHEELILQTRDVAYEVEYVINSLPPVWYLTLRLPQLIHKIQLISMDVIKINRQTDASGEKKGAKCLDEQASASFPSKRTQVLEENVLGFKHVAKEIMDQLVAGTEHLQIISIFGMPGLGKTTLANKLYNHPSIAKHFDCRAWCVSSQTYNNRNMLIDILMSLGRLNREDIKEDENCGEKVYKFIKRRRYLLVIDDIWDINAWDDLKRYFPNDGTGSRIVFTTRNKRVGLEASASVMKELPFLSNDDCWELLQRKVFQDEKCPLELLDIGKKIATKCQGLPLAVVVIAGILTNMEKKGHLWQNFESKISFHIARSPSNCMQVLELSYKHLPIHLKPCFLYFGAFKEDTEIPIQMLMSIWIAEGLIKKEERKSLEDVALEYLLKLIDRSLVLVSKRSSNGHVKTCKIHDLLLDMCSRIAEENFFVKKIDLSDHDGVLYHQHHCVSFISKREKPSNYIPPFGVHVRSLLCADAHWPMLFSCSFKALKVLQCGGEWSLRPAIGTDHLVQLRYLAINSDMPEIESCQRLEFLEVGNIDGIGITEVFLNMVNLKRMYFKGGAYFSKSCRQQATNEENFQINNKVMQSISVVKISDEIDEKILRCFPNLRRLEAELLGSFKFSFDFLDQLESLKLVACSSSNFINLPSNLRHLTLSGANISREKMEMIEILESLEVLKLNSVYFEGEQWDTSESAFPKLKVLKLKHVRISKWNASSDSFSSLQQLVLRECNSLDMIPSSFCDISTLQKIELIECPESVKESAKEIENYQKEMGNEELQVIESDY